MRAAIATSDYHVPGETFINRHIAHLFGGDTVIVTGRFNGDDAHSKPLFERRAKPPLSDVIRAPFWTVWNRVRHKTTRLPFGHQKAALAAFLRTERVEVILAEFGTQALALAPWPTSCASRSSPIFAAPMRRNPWHRHGCRRPTG